MQSMYFEEVEEEVVEERDGDVEGLGLDLRHPPHLLPDPPHVPHAPPALPRQVPVLLLLFARSACRGDPLIRRGQARRHPLLSPPPPPTRKKPLLGGSSSMDAGPGGDGAKPGRGGECAAGGAGPGAGGGRGRLREEERGRAEDGHGFGFGSQSAGARVDRGKRRPLPHSEARPGVSFRPPDLHRGLESELTRPDSSPSPRPPPLCTAPPLPRIALTIQSQIHVTEYSTNHYFLITYSVA